MSGLILAVDTSHRPGSIVLAEAGDATSIFLMQSDSLPAQQSTGQAFASRIRTMLRAAGKDPRDVNLVGINVGPGSFTGLRIGVTFAKTFAYVTGADLIGVPAMDILAEQALAARGGAARRLWTIIDAHRGQIFAARYDGLPGGSAYTAASVQLVGIEAWCGQLEAGDVVTGPIVERLVGRLPAPTEVIPASARAPLASTVAKIACERWQRGQRDDLWRIAPSYIRSSAAEERRQASGGTL